MGRHFRGACEVTLAAMLRGLRGKGRGRGFTRRKLGPEQVGEVRPGQILDLSGR